MTEPGVAPPAAPAPGAGALLRAAREKQGLHIGALAASLKVPQRKLEALEHDRWDELPDTAFARALAQSMCRVLKVDPAPVLALMPQGGAASLEPVSGGLNTPFRDRSGRSAEPLPALLARRPLVWAGGVLLLAALVLWWSPADWWRSAAPPAPPASAPDAFDPAVPDATASAAAADDAAPAAAAAPVAAEPTDAPAGPLASPAVAPAVDAAPATARDVLVVRASAPSWVEVVDATGATLVSRTARARRVPCGATMS
jgi:cytoskeleton protein RodZ